MLIGLTAPTPHITDHFGDESFQAINCTGTENQKQRKKIMHAKCALYDRHTHRDSSVTEMFTTITAMTCTVLVQVTWLVVTVVQRKSYVSWLSVTDIIFLIVQCVFHHRVWYRKLSQSSEFRHHPHPLGYLCAKFRFFCCFHCWATHGERLRTESITHPASVKPGNRSFCFRITGAKQFHFCCFNHTTVDIIPAKMPTVTLIWLMCKPPNITLVAQTHNKE